LGKLKISLPIIAEHEWNRKCCHSSKDTHIMDSTLRPSKHSVLRCCPHVWGVTPHFAASAALDDSLVLSHSTGCFLGGGKKRKGKRERLWEINHIFFGLLNPPYIDLLVVAV
jgi:hypothetical protein